jgi:two-component system invasion response regulator UvrY
MLIRVLLVDDHKLVRTGVRKILEAADGIEVIGEACSGEEGIQLARKLRPDIILMDMHMPGIGGLEATRKLLASLPILKVIGVSVQANDPFPSRLLEAGALGYLTKDCAAEEIVAAVKQVYQGKRYLTADVARELAMAMVSGRRNDSPFESLSQREMQVMLMVTRGQSVQDISIRLSLSPKTVSTYRSRLFQKLNVNNDVELMRLAMRYGVIEETSP